MNDWRREQRSQTFSIEKRGRMLRRAKRFGRPLTYEKTFTASAWIRGGEVTIHMELTPQQRVRVAIRALNGYPSAKAWAMQVAEG